MLAKSWLTLDYYSKSQKRLLLTEYLALSLATTFRPRYEAYPEDSFSS